MILVLSSGVQVRGDLIKKAVLRSDLTPVPVTLEAQIRLDDDMRTQLAVGRTLYVGGDQTALSIVKSQFNTGRVAQGDRAVAFATITAMLDVAHPVGFARRTAIIKENATLAAIYRATGAKLRSIEADFAVPRFYCPVGATPSFLIARVLQEEGGVVCWKSGRMRFMRLPDLFRQAVATDIPHNDHDRTESGFLERHSVPWFFSLNAAGEAVFGNRDKARAVRFAPLKDVQRLRNMTRCLVHDRVAKLDFSAKLCAGDLVNVVGGDPLAIVTAAHVYESGTEGETPAQYSRLWLSRMEE